MGNVAGTTTVSLSRAGQQAWESQGQDFKTIHGETKHLGFRLFPQGQRLQLNLGGSEITESSVL